MKRTHLAVVVALAMAACSDSGTASDMTGVGHDLSAAAPKGVIINEVFPHGSDELVDPDWAELKNTGDTTVDLSGYQVKDDSTTFTLPAGTTLAPGQYLVILCDDAPDGGAATGLHAPFKLGDGDEFHLNLADGTKVDALTWTKGTIPDGKSYGRLPDGSGAFTPLNPTRGTRNGV